MLSVTELFTISWVRVRRILMSVFVTFCLSIYLSIRARVSKTVYSNFAEFSVHVDLLL